MLLQIHRDILIEFKKGEPHEPEIEIWMRIHLTAGLSSALRVRPPALRNSA